MHHDMEDGIRCCYWYRRRKKSLRPIPHLIGEDSRVRLSRADQAFHYPRSALTLDGSRLRGRGRFSPSKGRFERVLISLKLDMHVLPPARISLVFAVLHREDNLVNNLLELSINPEPALHPRHSDSHMSHVHQHE